VERYKDIRLTQISSIPQNPEITKIKAFTALSRSKGENRSPARSQRDDFRVKCVLGVLYVTPLDEGVVSVVSGSGFIRRFVPALKTVDW
jgi:hypothetical protein